MKSRAQLIRLLFGICIFAVYSCSSKYQVFDLNSNQEATEPCALIFANDSMQISYDFWAEGGVMLSNILNKTNSDLYIRMDSSKFIINQEEIPYFDADRHPPSEPDTTVTLGYSPHSYFNPIVKIPANEDKWIEGFPITFEWQQVKNKTHTERYSNKNTPIYLINSLYLSFGDPQDELIHVQHEFWLSATHEASKSRFKRIDSLTRNKEDKFYLKESSAIKSHDPWRGATLSLLEELLYILGS